MRDVKLAAMPVARVKDISYLWYPECYCEIRFNRRAHDLPCVSVYSGWNVNAEHLFPASVYHLNYITVHTFYISCEPCAENRVHYGVAVCQFLSQRIHGFNVPDCKLKPGNNFKVFL